MAQAHLWIRVPTVSISTAERHTRRIESGDLVVIDVHPVVDMYTADCARTVVCGQPSPKQRQLIDLYQQIPAANHPTNQARMEGRASHSCFHRSFHQQRLLCRMDPWTRSWRRLGIRGVATSKS